MAAPSEKKKIGVSEDDVGIKWDHCLADTSIKLATGFGLGAVFSLILFRRRKWPVLFGTGVGLGMGYANCEHEFRNKEVYHGKLRKIEAGAPATT